MPKLKELIENLSGVVNSYNLKDQEIRAITYDSRLVEDGSLFFCITGYQEDGHNFITDAIRRGAVALVTERYVKTDSAIPQIQVRQGREAMAWIAAEFFGHPSHEIGVIGITGTNGKTTTAFLCQEVLKKAGWETGRIGTINYQWGGREVPAERTTPQSIDLQSLLRKMVDAKCKYVVAEISSHALVQHRADYVEFDAAIFTNLGSDHLDFHRNHDTYLQAKKRLFTELLIPGVREYKKAAIINVDDPAGREILSSLKGTIFTYGLENTADVSASDITVSQSGYRFCVHTPSGRFGIEMKLFGIGNVYNALAAFCLGLSYGVDGEVIKRAIEGITGIPGRFEIINWEGDFTIVVDYAHTADALSEVLNTARQLAVGRVISVFGCGGNRDRSKRPVMGKVAAQLSDYVVLTSDNPRREEPETIIAEIEQGLKEINKENYSIIINRAEAIGHAIGYARNGDVVLVAGKGHENYQIFRDTVVPFDDRDVVRKILREK